MKQRYLKFNFSPWMAILLVLILAGCTSTLIPQPAPPEIPAESKIMDHDKIRPNPDLSPEEVVKIQVEALQNNDELDKGIEITFRFASPANKQATGPLNRFVRLVKNPSYRPMLNHRAAVYGPMKITGDTATQRVTITGADGSASVYIFELSKQDLPDCQGCWMTDTVVLAPTRQQELKEI
jgi:hypothetical protein